VNHGTKAARQRVYRLIDRKLHGQARIEAIKRIRASTYMRVERSSIVVSNMEKVLMGLPDLPSEETHHKSALAPRLIGVIKQQRKEGMTLRAIADCNQVSIDVVRRVIYKYKDTEA